MVISLLRLFVVFPLIIIVVVRVGGTIEAIGLLTVAGMTGTRQLPTQICRF
jgi:hypothetical protein